MKVGDYVRTPLGIAKYIGKYDMAGNLDDWYEFDKLNEELWFGDIANVIYKNQLKETVLKSSPNIIDLIEVGDYVNGVDVGFVDKKAKRILCYGVAINAKDIKSIVTKEQFESMEYEVK